MKKLTSLFLVLIIATSCSHVKTDQEKLEVSHYSTKGINSFMFIYKDMNLAELIHFLDSSNLRYELADNTLDLLKNPNEVKPYPLNLYHFYDTELKRLIFLHIPITTVTIYNYKISDYSMNKIKIDFFDSLFLGMAYQGKGGADTSVYKSGVFDNSFIENQDRLLNKHDSLMSDIYEGLCFKYGLPYKTNSITGDTSQQFLNSWREKKLSVSSSLNSNKEIDGYYAEWVDGDFEVSLHKTLEWDCFPDLDKCYREYRLGFIVFDQSKKGVLEEKREMILNMEREKNKEEENNKKKSKEEFIKNL